jgi:hypothetical protein
VDGNATVNHQVSNDINLEPLNGNTQNVSAFRGTDETFRRATASFLATGSDHFNWAIVIIDQPTDDMNIPAFNGAVYRVHDLVLFAGDWKWSSKFTFPVP